MSESVIPDDAERIALRGGGTIAVGDGALVVVRDSAEPIRVEYDNIVEVTRQDIDWFLTILSLTLIGFGVVSIPRNAVIGAGFAVAGVGSLYLTYRKRGRVDIRVTGRTKPLTVYPESATDLYERLEVLAAKEA